VLWLAAVALLPVPYWAIEVERAPVLRLLLLAAMTAAAWGAEPGGVLSIVAGALVVQSVLWLGVLWLAAHLVVRWMPAGHRGAAVAALVVALLAVSLLPVHHVPFSRSGPRGSLLDLWR
jgi:hypothetical protein